MGGSMPRRSPFPFLVTAGLLIASFPAPSRAGQTVEAGQTLSLKEDLVLTGEESLDVKGTAERRCTLAGNGFRIRTKGPWTGCVRIRHCDVRRLGAPAKFTDDGRRIAAEFPAIDLTISGK